MSPQLVPNYPTCREDGCRAMMRCRTGLRLGAGGSDTSNRGRYGRLSPILESPSTFARGVRLSPLSHSRRQKSPRLLFKASQFAASATPTAATPQGSEGVSPSGVVEPASAARECHPGRVAQRPTLFSRAHCRC